MAAKTPNDFEGDTRVDGAVQDGYRYLVKFRDGTKEIYRDHDDLASVTARLDQALRFISGPKSLNPVDVDHQDPARLYFSGARAVEGQMVYDDRPPTDVIGEVRGKGWVWAQDVRSLAYTRLDGDEAPEAAYQAAAALLESQNRAQAEALDALQALQRKTLEDSLQGASGSNQSKDPTDLMG